MRASLLISSLPLLPFGLRLAGAPTAANPRVLYHSSCLVNSNFTNSPPLPSWSGPCVFCQDPDPKPLSGPCPASILYLTLPPPLLPSQRASQFAIILFIYSSLLRLHHPTLLLPADSKFVKAAPLLVPDHLYSQRPCSIRCLVVELLSRVQPFATPWTEPSRLLRPWDSLGKDAGVGCHSLLPAPTLEPSDDYFLSE